MVARQKLAYAVALGLAGASLIGCGEGDIANTGGGIGGTGVQVSGVVTGFGSVYVNGVKYNTDNASFTINGKAATEDALTLGMVVNVEGNNNGDGTGSATSISYDGQLEGPISSLAELDSKDSSVLLLDVFGITVALNARSTHFVNSNFTSIRDNNNELALGQMVELSGYYDDKGVLQASYFEKEDSQFIVNSSEIELLGTVSSLNEGMFDLKINATTTIAIDATNSELSGELIEGAFVQVEGVALAVDSTVLNATEIKVESFDEEQEIELQGLIQNYNAGNTTFMLNGVVVDASNAKLDQGALANDSLVEVDGHIVDNILVAKEVEFLDDTESFDYEFRAVVESTNIEANTITFNLGGENVTVLVDNRTVWSDDVDDERRINLASIARLHTLELDLQKRTNGWYANKVERVSSEIGFGAITTFSIDDINMVNRTVNVFGANVAIASYAEISDDLSVDLFLSKAHQFEEVELQATQGTFVIDKISIED